jgi:hypothetical protein
MSIKRKNYHNNCTQKSTIFILIGFGYCGGERSEKEQVIYGDVGHWGFSFINGMQHV